MQRNGIIVRRGVVDDVTPDGSVLWLAGEGIEPRRIFERADGYEACLLPREGYYRPGDQSF